MKSCYFIPDSGYDTLNDDEGVWKETPEDEWNFEKFYPEKDEYKLKDNEFQICANFEWGGWEIIGNIELFDQWIEETGHDPNYIYDEPPKEEI